MLAIDLPEGLAKHFMDVVCTSYHGDIQAAVIAFLHLHEKYGWKEQLHADVTAIRAEVRQQGGISAATIEETIQRYRETLEASGAANLPRCP